MSKDNFYKMRVIFYAEPQDNDQIPKQIPDKESLEARYVELKEFSKLGKIRGNELLQFGELVENGKVYPLSLFPEFEKN